MYRLLPILVVVVIELNPSRECLQPTPRTSTSMLSSCGWNIHIILIQISPSNVGVVSDVRATNNDTSSSGGGSGP